jgi:putative inorganic carbon (HCO3(-)) transporter
LYQDLTGSYSRDFGGLAYRNYDVLRDGDVRGRVERGKYDRAQGPVNEPNRFAQILIVLVPMAAYLYRTTNRPGRRRFILACGALILIGIALTLSRGAIVALALMAAAMTRLRWVRPSRVGTCVIALLLALPLITPFYLDRVASLINVTRFMGGDQSDYREADGAMRGRVTEMLAAWRVFVDHPLLGVGPGQFAPYYVERYSRDPEIKFRQIVGARRAHTLYFEVAAETGLLGLVLFMGIAVHLLRRLWWTRSAWLARDPALADLATAFWLSVMAYLCTGVFLHLAYQRYYWLLIALATAALHVAAWKRPAAGRGAFAGGARWQRLH